WRVVSTGAAQQLALPRLLGGDPTSAHKGHRPVYFPEQGGFVSAPIYDRQRLGPGAQLRGPALIEERESTIVVRPGQSARVDRAGCILLEDEIRAGA
ncbi:MAG TPA: hypothetical protein PK954_23355, partial [Anaerolineales bacterium]|nr:hypothetical protein [Anaerolineales bacterium]